MRLNDVRTQHRLQQILGNLAERDMSRQELAAAMWMARPLGLVQYLDHLKRERRVHVARWTEPAANGVRWAVYRYGRGRNVPQPRALTRAEHSRLYRRRRGQGVPAVQVAQPFAVLLALVE